MWRFCHLIYPRSLVLTRDCGWARRPTAQWSIFIGRRQTANDVSMEASKSGMLVPLLTEKDPAVTAEGSIDPLSLFPIADSLAVQLVPGVRERQMHPRFLTAIAVSLELCSRFGEEQLASDGISEPWQVFEWYVVEGLVRTTESADFLRGLPGHDKTASAVRDRVPLSAARYLVKPGTYGFHGVYRLLAETLGIQYSSIARLGETGAELIDSWSHEQKLPGFVGTGGEPGADWRERLAEAIADGLERGHVARKPGWNGWQFFAKHLGIYDMKKREAEVIRSALCRPDDGYRGTIFNYLVSLEGQGVWTAGAEDPSEREFHAALIRGCDECLRDHLQVIQRYEMLSRLLDDAFEDCLKVMTEAGTKTNLAELAEKTSIARAAEQVPDLALELRERLGPYGEDFRFEETFGDFVERLTPQSWTRMLLEHHHDVQRKKPPAGKMPWFEETDDGKYIIRPAYRRDAGGRGDDRYVNAYRTNSLWSFAADLKLVS